MQKLTKLIVESDDALEKLYQDDARKIEQGLVAPWVGRVEVSSLGGIERSSMTIKTSLLPRDKWANSIFHNSPYSIWIVRTQATDGKIQYVSMEQISPGIEMPRFRKTAVKSADDVIRKANEYNKKCQELFKKG